jgi:hypothetical protein
MDQHDIARYRATAPRPAQSATLATMRARIAELENALREIAARGPIAGYTSASALRLRLVGSQSIARAVLSDRR